jgi:hypothetical protein
MVEHDQQDGDRPQALNVPTVSRQRKALGRLRRRIGLTRVRAYSPKSHRQAHAVAL